MEREKASEPEPRQQITEIEKPNETVVFDDKTGDTATGQVRPIEKTNETVVFDHSQGGNAFFVYVPEQTVRSDMDFYRIAFGEYQKRGGDRFVAFFYSDIQDAEDASCYKKPDKHGFPRPCDGALSTQYSSLMARVSLEEESRSLTRYSPSPNELAAELDDWGWGHSPNSASAYETVLEYSWNSSDFGKSREIYVLVPDQDASSDSPLCAIAYRLHQEHGQGVDNFAVVFVTRETSAVSRARAGQAAAKFELFEETVARIDVDVVPGVGLPYRYFRRVGPWDANVPFPTCE